MNGHLGRTFIKSMLSSNVCYRCYPTNTIVANKVDFIGQALADKGFLRPHKPYSAPNDASEKVKAICASMLISPSPSYRLKSLEEKFNLLESCRKQFQHSVPNSQVHELKTVGDVIGFYETSLSSTVPYDALAQMELPENLHIQHAYVRFNSESDTKFKGQTAYPKSSTLVTGLKYRDKYEGNEAKHSWP